MRSIKGLAPKVGTEQWVKLLWYVGFFIWGPMLVLLWLRLRDAQTVAPASLGGRRLAIVSFIGMFWSVTGPRWLAKLRKNRTP
jgi:hypothetical protein